MQWEIKLDLRTVSFTPLLSMQLQLYSQFLPLFSTSRVGGQGMGVIHISLPLSSSRSSPAPVWSPSKSTLPELLQSGSFPLASVLHELLQSGSLLWDAVLQELQHGSPLGSQVLPVNQLQCGSLSPWACRSCQELPAVRASHMVTSSFRTYPAAPVGCFSWTDTCFIIHWLQRTICLIMDCKIFSIFINFIFFPLVVSAFLSLDLLEIHENCTEKNYGCCAVQ